MSYWKKTYLQGLDQAGVTRDCLFNVDGAIRVVNQDYLLALSEGDISGHTRWEKFGFNDAIGTTQLTLGPAYSADYVWPTGNTQMSIRSSDNTQDKAGGTGARTVTLYYLDSAYAEKSVDVNLNGTTWVDLSVADVFRVQNMRTKTVGAGGKPVGNITLADTATKGITYGYISAGRNRQRQFIWTVPAGKTLYITQASIYAMCGTANKYCRIILEATYDNKSGTVLTPGVHFIGYAEGLGSQFSNGFQYGLPIKFPAQTDIKASAIAQAASSGIS